MELDLARLLPRRLVSSETGDAVTVLCDAFRNYPVMRYVLGSREGYERRLHTFIGFFVTARVLRDELVLGIPDTDGTLVAAALVSLPGERPVPEALATRREAVWVELGTAERNRYERFGLASAQFGMDCPHYYLDLIGVRRSHMGRGLGRKLLELVHELSDSDPRSCGVALSTETRHNLPLYQHFDYRLLGHAQVSEELETWAFFREAIRR
jgi:GNAT superfamily N-acetyltransferase